MWPAPSSKLLAPYRKTTSEVVTRCRERHPASKAGCTDARLHWTPCKPPLDKMTSGHPIIIQIKTLLNEANRVAAARTLL